MPVHRCNHYLHILFMKRSYFAICCLCLSLSLIGQQPADTVVAANPSLAQRTDSWKKNWGHNRRAEWATPVRVPLYHLDSPSVLKPYQQGGGNESKSLRLTDTKNREYAMRSVNKSRDDVIADEFRKTFIETIIRDQLSSSHPYGALAVPGMMQAAGLPHARPVLVYVPSQNRLDSFNARFGNDLYMLEQRPDGDWSTADHFNNHEDFSSTEKLIKELLENNRSVADQFTFIKARLFDMLIADWDRHEDNWRWGKRKTDDGKFYTPIARDRDQAFYTHNGKLIDKFLPAAGLSFMQHFDTVYGKMSSFNKQERNFDRFFANAMSLDDWLKAAAELQQQLTDEVIYQSVKGMPAEIVAISGNEIAEKLIARRKQLPAIAAGYYAFIAREVDIPGSDKKEYFEISRGTDGSATVQIFRYDKNNNKETTPYYQRMFKPEETSEIRVYGLDSDDVFAVSGSSPITIRIIGGPGNDSVMHSGDKVHVYDNHENYLQGNIARHLAPTPRMQAYKYANHEYDSKGIMPLFGFNREDRIYAGLNWNKKTHRWNKDPYGSLHNIDIIYSFTQGAADFKYSGMFPQTVGTWDLFFTTSFDIITWRNYAGLGNDVTWKDEERLFYQQRSRDWNTALGVSKSKGKNTVAISLVHQYLDNLYDKGRYADKVYSAVDPAVYNANHYGGIQVKYTFVSVNDKIVPVKGFTCLLEGALLDNFSREHVLQKYTARMQTWLPLSNKFSLCFRGGGETVISNTAALQNSLAPEHAILSGFTDIRGYRPERFWGRSAVYGNSELRFITNVRGYLLNAKIGLLGFADAGRVWVPGETSDTFHSSWGGGVLFSPFHFASFTLTYGITKETKLFQFRVLSLF